MTRFVVDCGVVLHLASEPIEIPAWLGRKLEAATVRPGVLSPSRALDSAVASGRERTDSESKALLRGRLAQARIRNRRH